MQCSDYGTIWKRTTLLKWIVTTFLAGSLWYNATAQEILVSPEIPVKAEDQYELIGKFDDRILLVKLDGNKCEIHGYANDLQTHWEREIEFEKSSAQIITVVPGDTSFHVVYGYKHKGDYYLKHREYDPSVILVDSLTIEVIPNVYFAPKFQSVRSDNYTKALLVRTDRESDITVASYDLLAKRILWTKQILFDGISFRRDFRLGLITNNGDMFMVMDHEKNSKRYKEFNVMYIMSGHNVLRRTRIEMGDQPAQDLYATFDNTNHRLVVSGLYNEKVMSKSIGLYVYTLDPATKESRLHRYPFEEDMLEEVHGKAVSSNKGVTDFLVKNIILRQDGGAVILAEMHKEYGRRPNIPVRRGDFGPTGWVDYYFEDVMAISIHPDGELHWQTVLHKKQYSQDDDGMYSSFFVFRTPEMIRLLYNDEIRNQSTVSEYIIRGNGYHKRRSVFSTEYQKLGLRFRDAIQIGFNEFVIPSERNNRLNLVRIRFDQT